MWKRTPPLPYTEYTAKCCDLLESAGYAEADQVLVWLVRIQRLAEEISDFQKKDPNAQNKYQVSLMLKGMEAQLDEWEARMSPYLPSNRKF